jgi:hypothetical protein
MTKTAEALVQPVFKNVLVQRQDAALQFMGAQALNPKWETLPDSKPVRLMKLLNGMCRWPIGDPQNHEAFRFCGAGCNSGDSYCDAHKKMAFAPVKTSRGIPAGKVYSVK